MLIVNRIFLLRVPTLADVNEISKNWGWLLNSLIYKIAPMLNRPLWASFHWWIVLRIWQLFWRLWPKWKPSEIQSLSTMTLIWKSCPSCIFRLLSCLKWVHISIKRFHGFSLQEWHLSCFKFLKLKIYIVRFV